jgi:hypothetical protein
MGLELMVLDLGDVEVDSSFLVFALEPVWLGWCRHLAF